MPVFDQKYLKTKVREFSSVIKANFLGNKIPKENKHYTCIACITIESVMRMDKKNYPQVYLEECKYKIKKNKNKQIHRSQTRIRFGVRTRVRIKITRVRIKI